MTLSPLLIKAVLGTVAVGTTGTAASFKIYQTYVASQTGTDKPSDSTTPSDTGQSSENGTASTPLQPTEDTTAVAINPVVLVTPKIPLTSESQLTVHTTNENYKCQLAGDTSTLGFCRILKLEFTNNWIDVNGIKKANSTDTVALTDLQVEDNHFKLEVNQTLHSKFDLTTNKHIEIISTAGNNKFAKLNVSFKVSGSDIDYASTNYLLGKHAPASVAYDASKNYECPISASAPTSESPNHACSIYPFGSTAGTLTGAGYHKQAPTDLLNAKATSPLTKDQYYILKYTNPVSKSDLTATKSAYINKNESSTVENIGNFKNLVPAITQGTTNKKLFILSETPSYSIIVKKDTQLASDKTISHTSTVKNYHCKYDASEAFDCEMVDLELSQSKTLIDIAGIKNADLTSDLLLPQAESKIQYFKLDVPLARFETIKSNLKTAPTAVKLVEITDATNKIVDLTPIFAIDDDNVPFFQKSTFLVKTAVISGDDITGDGAFDDSKTHYCSFSTTNTPDSNPAKCKLIDLGSSEISSSQEITDTEATNPITTEKNYLVKFIDDNGGSISVAQGATGDNNTLFLQEGGVDATKKLVAKFANEHIQPALVVDGDSSKKHLFILT